MLANFLNTWQTFVCQHCWQTHVGQHLFVMCLRLYNVQNTFVKHSVSATDTSCHHICIIVHVPHHQDTSNKVINTIWVKESCTLTITCPHPGVPKHKLFPSPLHPHNIWNHPKPIFTNPKPPSSSQEQDSSIQFSPAERWYILEVKCKKKTQKQSSKQ